MVLFGAAADWLNIWLTPLWLLGVGALAGLAVLVLLWGVLAVLSRSAAREVPTAVSEGPLLWIARIIFGCAVFGLMGAWIVRDRGELIRSLGRLPAVGTEVREFRVAARSDAEIEPEPYELTLPFRGDEITRLEVNSTGHVEISTPPNENGEIALSWEVYAEDPFVWARGTETINPLAGTNIEGFSVKNLGDGEAKIDLTVHTAPLHAEVLAIPITAVSVVGVFLIYLLIRWLSPKTAAIALAASKSEMAQPLYLVLAVLGLFLLGLFLFIPYHTFGEDIKVLKDSGLTLIMVFCIFHAVWAASNSVADEIEGRTALTVLSKPIGRRQFILGKFLGIGWTELTLFVLLGLWFLIIVAYKPIYDAREGADFEPTWQLCYLEMARTVPGLVLAFLETLVFIAISVAISTRLPMLANVSICFAVYALGHLTPLIVQSNLNRFEPVVFIGKLIATVLPVLDHFNIQAAIASGVPVPMSYLGVASVYCAVYCAIALVVALAMFEDRDLT